MTEQIVEEIHEYDIGTKLRVLLKDGSSPVNLTNAETLKIYLLKPDETTLNKTAIIENVPGVDGIMYYTSILNDLTPPGTWTIQGYAKITDKGEWRSSMRTFEVLPNIIDPS